MDKGPGKENKFFEIQDSNIEVKCCYKGRSRRQSRRNLKNNGEGDNTGSIETNSTKNNETA